MNLPNVKYPIVVKDQEVYCGDDFVMELVCTHEDDGSIVDISGLTGWRAQTRQNTQSKTALDFSIDASKTNQGILVLSLTDDQTTQMRGMSPWGWDVEGVQSDGRVLTFAKGVLPITLDWTHS